MLNAARAAEKQNGGQFGLNYLFGDVGRVIGDAFEAFRDHHEVEAAGDNP